MFHDWRVRYGFTDFSEVGKSRSKITRSDISAVGDYVAKYCLKPPQLSTDVEKHVQDLINSGVISPTFYLMSKGIGKSYIDRMKRYHVPLGTLMNRSYGLVCDRAFYHSSSFKYKLPRYYRDRLYRKLCPCDAKVWNYKTKNYEEKIVYRYKSSNMLSRQMQVEIRNRILAEYFRRCAELRSKCPSLSDTQISLELQRSEIAARNFRRQTIYTKMSRFYNRNRFKQRKF